ATYSASTAVRWWRLMISIRSSSSRRRVPIHRSAIAGHEMQRWTTVHAQSHAYLAYSGPTLSLKGLRPIAPLGGLRCQKRISHGQVVKLATVLQILGDKFDSADP